MKKKIRKFIKDYTFKLQIVELIKWKLIDLYRLKRYGVKPHLFGVRCITGMYGCGKTVTMTYIAQKYRNKYGDSIYICSNFGLLIQDFAFTSLDQLTKQYDKPIIFLWDEVQNDFPAQEKVFPKAVRQALTLNRKGNGKMFFWASQDHELVHKTIRRLTIEYAQVKTIFKRWTKIRWYKAIDYDLLFNENDVRKRMKIHPFKTEKFVQSDNLRNLYNSYAWDNGEKIT